MYPRVLSLQVDPTWIQGTLPKELNGTLLRNAPGLFEYGQTTLDHPFDGDGLLFKFVFSEGRVHVVNRFVRTKEFLDEQAAGQFIYRSAFSAGLKEGEWFVPLSEATKVKNPANTNVIYWGGKVRFCY